MAKMKRSEIILWTMVAIALAANIWLPKHMNRKYSWERDLSQRLAVDFCKTKEEVKGEIREFYPYVSDAEIDGWTESGKLESMVIGKRTMYFKDAAANLKRIDPDLFSSRSGNAIPSGPYSAAAERGWTRPEGDGVPDDAGMALPDYSSIVLPDGFLEPVRMRVRFSITVPVHTLKPGKTLRCWLPYPRSDVPRQSDIKFIEAGVDSVAYPIDKITFSDPSCPHSSLYMEAKTNRYRDITFYEVFEYTSSGEFHPINPSEVREYDTSNDEYKEYTSERDRHIIFTDRIKALADSLTDGIDNPFLQASAMFTWIDRNIPWASAREYSTIENIPEYVISVRHGDCGQKTLLFMTLCRYKGIPTRWQSGFYTAPGEANLHDWGEIYFEGYGWMPVDQSFGIIPNLGYFYLGGLDPNRLIVNSDFGREMSPSKKYPRSETVDFQRGEVEWEGGNLYFNQWNYDFNIEYLQ